VVKNANLQLRAQVLTTSSNSMFHAKHDPLIHKHPLRNLVLKHAKKYSQTTRALASFSPTPTSFDSTLTFIILHLKSDFFSSFFWKTTNQTKTLNFHLIISS